MQKQWVALRLHLLDALKGSLIRSGNAKSKITRRKRKRSKSALVVTHGVLSQSHQKHYRNFKELSSAADAGTNEAMSPYHLIQLMCCFGCLRVVGKPGTAEGRATEFSPPVVALSAETVRHVLDMQAAEVSKSLVSMAAVQRFVLRVMRLQLLQLRGSALSKDTGPLLLLQVQNERACK